MFLDKFKRHLKMRSNTAKHTLNILSSRTFCVCSYLFFYKDHCEGLDDIFRNTNYPFHLTVYFFMFDSKSLHKKNIECVTLYLFCTSTCLLLVLPKLVLLI